MTVGNIKLKRSMAHMFGIVILISLVNLNCRERQSDAEASVTLTAPSGQVSVINHHSQVRLNSWKYLDPTSPDHSKQPFPTEESGAISFGSDRRRSFIVWREDGFNMVWGDSFCAGNPVLLIRDATIEFWPDGNGFTEMCEDIETVHIIQVNTESDESISDQDWGYILHEGLLPSEIE